LILGGDLLAIFIQYDIKFQIETNPRHVEADYVSFYYSIQFLNNCVLPVF